MGLDTLKISSCKPMNSIIGICLIIALGSIVYRAFIYNKSDDNAESFKQDEMLLIMFKFAFYLLLAGYIYLVFKKSNFPEIDVLTFFTFLLACFEATHNFLISIGSWLGLFISFLI